MDDVIEAKVQKYMGLNYATTAYNRGGRSVLFIPELSLVAEGADYDGAFEQLQSAKKELFETYMGIGQENRIPLPAGSARFHDLAGDLVRLAVKTIVVMAIVALALTFAAYSTTSIVESKLATVQLTQTGLSRIHQAVDYLANVHPETKRQLRDDVRILARELKPYVEDWRNIVGPPVGNAPSQ